MALILRFWAVYGGSAALLLWLSHRFIRRLRLPIACLLALGPCLLAGKAMMTGGVLAPLDITYSNGEPLASLRPETDTWGPRTPLLSDVVNQDIPSRKAVREAIKHVHLPLWNRFSTVGEPLLAFLQPEALSPATWIGFALPLANAWTFQMAFRLLLAMLSAYLFFREIECREWSALLGAAAWALSDHLVFWLGYAITASVAAFPLLLLGLRRLARAGGRGAVALTVVALVLITLGGHPETLLHSVVGGGIYFLFELAWAGRDRRRPALGGALLSGALALGLTAVLLLPFAEIAPRTEAHRIRYHSYAFSKKSVSLSESLRRCARDVLPYAFGVSGRGKLAKGFGVPAGYAGALAFPLAVIGLRSRRRERWEFAALGLLGLALWARLAGVADVIGRLPFLDVAINDYLVFLGCFGIVGLAVLGVDRLLGGESTGAFAAACLVWAAATSALFVAARTELLGLGMDERYLVRRLALQLVPLVAGAAAVFLLRRRSLAAAATVVLLFVLFRAMEASGVYPTFPARAFYPVPEVLAALPRAVPERVAALGVRWVPNMSAMYELQDVRGYGAMVLTDLVETYPLWCVPQPVWFNRVDDASRPFLSFLNVRYVFTGAGETGPAGWRLLGEGRGGRVFENPRVLPRAFIPGHVGWLQNPSLQIEILTRVTDYGGFGVVERGADRQADSADWEPNGPGTVRIVSDTGQKLVLEIEASGKSVVATSLPRWPGWKAKLDGERIPTFSFDRAFVGFSVPPGRHAVVLEYFPDGFVRGAAVSGATFVLALALLVRRRKGGPG
jgi:hypothetical protein